MDRQDRAAWEQAWEQRTLTDARRVRLWAPADRIRALASDMSATTPVPSRVQIHERVDLCVFPSFSRKSRVQPLGRLDVVFLQRADFDAWVEAFVQSAAWTRRQGLVAWCTSSPGAPEEAARGHGAHRRCCCFAHHPPGGCDVCDATRLEFARRRYERRAHRAARLRRTYGAREQAQAQAQAQAQEWSHPTHDEFLFLFVAAFVGLAFLTSFFVTPVATRAPRGYA